MADAPEVTLTWDIKNWITVLLMVAIGFAALALAAQLVKNGPSLLSKVNLAPSGTNNSPSIASAT